MKKEFPLEAECCICEKYVECVARDEELEGAICKECLPHVKLARKILMNEMVQCRPLE